MLRFTHMKIAPSKPALKCLAYTLAAIFSSAILLAISDNTEIVSVLNTGVAVLIVLFVVVSILDVWVLLSEPMLNIRRTCPKSIAVDKWTEVKLSIQHSFNTPRVVSIFDDLGQNSEYEHLPSEFQLRPGQVSTITYRLKVTSRGPFTIGQTHVSVSSPLRLWKGLYRTGAAVEIKVYPDFSAMNALSILATDNHESQIGIKKKPRRGEGMDFMQLRDYRNGDSLRQIDWKATSRRSKLISKEYQDERDQQIVLLIDSGRRMRSKDDTLSHFDHSLNATLLVSYLALRQGDSVSVMSFGESHRWIAPQKGVASMKTILNGMYDLHAEQCAPDYVAAAEKLASLQRKRSLVILVTNSRDEEVEELLLAANLLRRRHVLLIANIRESVIDNIAHQDIDNLDAALSYTGLQQYLKRRHDVHQKIVSSGVYTVDCLAKELAIRVSNSYLEIKRAGVL